MQRSVHVCGVDEVFRTDALRRLMAGTGRLVEPDAGAVALGWSGAVADATAEYEEVGGTEVIVWSGDTVVPDDERRDAGFFADTQHLEPHVRH